MTIDQRIAAQNAEFDALTNLSQAWARLRMTPVVDDDYPEQRHYYESAVQSFIRAMIANGRPNFAPIEGRIISIHVDMINAQFLSDVNDELLKARKKFPDSQASVVALMEEVGELAKATLCEPDDNIRKEAVQVAAMACRISDEGDSTLDTYRVANGFGVRVMP